MYFALATFCHDDRGAVSVDWTTLSAAAVGMSLATAAALNGTFQTMISRMDGELRDQQMSDDFVGFTPAHFENLFAENQLQEEDAEAMFTVANELLNQEIINALEKGIEGIENGTLTPSEIAELVAIASVAWQRNVVDDPVLDYYFGFGGNESPRIGQLL
jgi:hypothetical protein